MIGLQTRRDQDRPIVAFVLERLLPSGNKTAWQVRYDCSGATPGSVSVFQAQTNRDGELGYHARLAELKAPFWRTM